MCSYLAVKFTNGDMKIVAFSLHLMRLVSVGWALEIERTYRYSNTPPAIGAHQRTVQKRSKIDCAASCSEDDHCVAFTFDKTTKTCSMSNGSPNPIAGSLYREKGCPEKIGYTYVQHLNLCFRMEGDTGYNLQQIKGVCTSESAHLVLIKNTHVDNFLVDEIRRRGLDAFTNRMYIDGNDEAVNGEWRSHSGELMSYFNFDASRGEPTGSSTENCLYISTGAFRWFDSTCNVATKTGGFICQIDVW